MFKSYVTLSINSTDNNDNKRKTNKTHFE